MSVKITRVDLPKLWNSEYTIFVNQLINIISKHQPENLHLEKAFNKLAAFVPDLAKIKVQELSNAISRLLSDLDKERDILFNTIVGQVKVLAKVNLPAITPHVAILRSFINIHGDDIADAPYNAETKRLDDLKAGYQSKAKVKAAADALNMGVLFDQLFLVNANFASQFMQRTKEESSTEKVNTRAIR